MSREITCPTCGGTGEVYKEGGTRGSTRVCSTCRGSGTVPDPGDT